MSASAFVVRRGRASLRVQRRTASVFALCLVAIPLALVVSVAVGEFPVPLSEAFSALVGRGDPGTSFVIHDLRLPRALAALLAGAALGISGAIFQEVTRNALVSPDIVGVSGGASAAACAVIVLTPWDGPWAVPLGALAGALVSGALLFGLSWRDGLTGYRVVLVGIGLSSLALALTSYVLTRGRVFEVGEAYVWLVGTVNGRGWDQVTPLAMSMVLLVPASLLAGRQLDALVLGDDIARGLGAPVGRSRAGLLVLATLLTAVAVATAGPIGFVAFIAPHLARRALDSRSATALMPASAACGALLVLVADVVSRLIFAPTEMPVGLITSILAAPYFLVMLRRAANLGAAG
ncbi:MAG: iron ABC transporter permease [Solirubrobacteraceae bacterium]|nr:iron ABC transporter permease [Solirubrobacteraceae bacterium]